MTPFPHHPAVGFKSSPMPYRRSFELPTAGFPLTAPGWETLAGASAPGQRVVPAETAETARAGVAALSSFAFGPGIHGEWPRLRKVRLKVWEKSQIWFGLGKIDGGNSYVGLVDWFSC
jgi:hypothetical protein